MHKMLSCRLENRQDLERLTASLMPETERWKTFHRLLILGSPGIVSDESTGRKFSLVKENERLIGGRVRLRLDLQLVGQLREGLKRMETFHRQSAVVVIGATGDGKSTLIANLMGCRMRWNASQTAIDPDSFSFEGATPPVGHSANPETFYPTPYIAGSESLVDCPGFEQNRDLSLTLVKTFCVKAMAEHLSTCRVVLCISGSKLFDSRADGLLQSLRDFSGFIKGRFSDFQESVLLVVTKATVSTGYRRVEDLTLDRILTRLREIQADFSRSRDPQTGQMIEALRFLCRGDGQYISISFPTDEGQSRGTILTALSGLSAIEARGKVNIPYSADVSQILTEDFSAIANEGNTQLDQFDRQTREWTTIDLQLGQVQTKIAEKVEKIRSLNSPVRPDVLRERLNAKKREHQANLNRLTRETEDLNHRILIVTQKIQQLRDDKSLVHLHSEGIEEPEIERPKTPEKGQFETLGQMVGGAVGSLAGPEGTVIGVAAGQILGKEIDRQTTTKKDIASGKIGKSFQYEGYLITCLEKSGFTNDVLKEEGGEGHTFYRVSYMSQPFRPASFHYRIFTEKCRLPETQAQVTQLETEKQGLQATVNEKGAAIQNLRQLVDAMESEIQGTYSKQAELEAAEQALTEARITEGTLNGQRLPIETELSRVRSEIENSRPQAQFLLDFMDLTAAKELVESELISGFSRRYRIFSF